MTFDEHLAEKLKDPEFRAEWEAHEDCFQRERELVLHLIEAQGLARDLYELLSEFGQETDEWSEKLLAKYPWLKRQAP